MSHLTDKETEQRNGASKNAKHKRNGEKYSDEVLRLLADLIIDVTELQKINAPPLKLPVGTSSSVIEVNRPRSVEPDGDTQINNFINNLRIDLLVKRDQARGLRKRKR